MDPDLLDIGDVAARTGVTVAALRHYESVGLIESTARRGLRRQFPPEVLLRLALIQVCAESGFTLAEIRDLLDHGQDWRRDAETKLAELRERRARIDVAITGIEHALRCPVEPIVDCPHFSAILDTVVPDATRASTGTVPPAG
jgi:DNA-binding transcriptional MerR regulator